TEDQSCRFKDEKIRRLVEDRINKDFIGTLEDDKIIYTMLDLEQFIGQEINWVSGITFDEIVETKGGWLPNKLHRYCTVHLKVEPIFYWCAENTNLPIILRFGYRANEFRRAKKVYDRAIEGSIYYKATFGKHQKGRHVGKNKWEEVEYYKPQFPLIEDQIYKDNIERFWEGKPVRFAEHNNCVGCFHRNHLLLKRMYESEHKNKMLWFEKQEGGKNGYWKSNVSYEQIRKHPTQLHLELNFSECDSGFCEL
ncbi:MAG: hypothetical protein AAF806_29405, partial [Bacteroidota bacterium]